MNAHFRILAAATVAFGAALAAVPAAAQGGYDGYGPGWRDGRYPPRYEWGNPYYGVDAGETDIAICPPGYRLGRSGRLCWPD